MGIHWVAMKVNAVSGKTFVGSTHSPGERKAYRIVGCHDNLNPRQRKGRECKIP